MRGTDGRPRAGDRVRVRSAEEILRTLEPDGTLEGLPFMPEMLQMCGREFTVDARADTTCWNGGLWEINDAVHLQGVRCDGSAHGGCQAGCVMFFKDVWLQPADSRDPGSAPPTGARSRPEDQRPAVSIAQLHRYTRRPDPAGDVEALYRCQATDLPRAAHPLHFWDVRHFLRDIRSGNRSGRVVLRYILPYLINTFQALSRLHLPERLRIAGGNPWPFVYGKNRSTPREQLDLRPGERVRIKSRSQIRATLNETGHNRGLSFDPEMLEHCGTVTTVNRRIARFIDENTGRMLHPSSDCLVLDGVTCRGKYKGLCNRQTESYWREIWLERLDEPPALGEEAGR